MCITPAATEHYGFAMIFMICSVLKIALFSGFSLFSEFALFSDLALFSSLALLSRFALFLRLRCSPDFLYFQDLLCSQNLLYFQDLLQLSSGSFRVCVFIDGIDEFTGTVSTDIQQKQKYKKRVFLQTQILLK